MDHIIIQNPQDGTAVNNVQRVVKNIVRDLAGNQTGDVRINKIDYEVSYNFSDDTWYGDAVTL